MSDSWVDDLVEESSHVETPTSWLWWSYLVCISAAAGNNYHLTSLKGHLTYKPNIYVMLLGESGLGKGFPISRASMLLKEADVTRVIKGRSTIQAVVRELATAKTAPGKAPIEDSRACIINGELSTAIVADPDALTILTDLFDGNFNPDWTNLLKGDGPENLKNPYITCLFGSSPAHFYDSIPQANIEGGYIGRNLIIYEEKRSKDVDLLDDETEEEEALRKDKDIFKDHLVPKYIPHLKTIAEHKGRIIPSSQARTLFNTWRKDWRASQAKYNDRTGFINRVPDHVLKVAMCLTLAHYDQTSVISIADMEIAIAKVVELVYASQQASAGIGLDPLAAQTKLVLNFLIAAPDQQLTRKQLLSKGYGNFDTPTLERIVENLLEMGWLTRQKTLAGTTAGSTADWRYHLAGEPLEGLKRFKEGRK